MLKYLGLERVPINDLSDFLGNKDNRTTYTWCKQNQLIIFKDGRTRFVLKKELGIALDGSILDKLKEVYPNNWKMKYNELKGENPTVKETKIVSIQSKLKKSNKTNTELNFLDSIKSITNKAS